MTNTTYLTQVQAPSRDAINALLGSVLLEFGTDWCSHCTAAQPLIAQALSRQKGITHVKIEDGPSRSLGRSYGVKLWPTLVFLRDGQELTRIVRPQEPQALEQALKSIAVPGHNK